MIILTVAIIWTDHRIWIHQESWTHPGHVSCSPRTPQCSGPQTWTCTPPAGTSRDT